MTESANERQDPSEVKEVDTAVETEEQAPSNDAPTYAETQPVQVSPGVQDQPADADEDSSDES